MKKRILTYGLSLAALLGLAILAGVVMHSYRSSRSLLTCTGIQVEFKDSLRFVSQEDIENYLKQDYGAYIGQKLDSVSLCRIESLLDSRSAIMSSQAWATDDGTLHISILQRQPAVRFSKGDVGFYADREGYIFPLHPSFTADVPVVSGAIPLSAGNRYRGFAQTEREQEWISEVLDMFQAFDSARGWKGRIESVSVRSSGDLAIRLKDAAETFIIGEPCDIRSKISRMDRYFSHILPAREDRKYKTVNVKYNGQIVCRKDT